MKLRLTFLAFASLLLVGSLASAHQASQPADPESATLSAIFSAPASPDCAAAKQPSFQLPPVDLASFICGACSDSACVGAQRGSFCGFHGGQTYTCQPAFAVCTFKDCQCWTGPLP